MEYEWDEAKRLANLRKHGIDFTDVPAVFDGDILTVEDDRYSYGKQRNMNNESTSNNSQTDWQRLDAMTDEEIDLSDCPEITPEMFAKAVVRRGLPVTKAKTQVTLRIDSDVLDA